MTYASKPGDPRRSGHAGQREAAAPIRIALRFERRADGCMYCVLARAVVGVICEQPPGCRPGFNWLCTLPEQRVTPQFAADIDKAKDAMRSVVETWCEAAGLAARPRRRRNDVRAWRSGEGD